MKKVNEDAFEVINMCCVGNFIAYTIYICISYVSCDTSKQTSFKKGNDNSDFVREENTKRGGSSLNSKNKNAFISVP